jgi:hypothetical protein
LRTGGRVLCAVLLFSLVGLLPAGAAAQRSYRPPKVYNPNVYSRTRRTMSDRAAVRAARASKKESAARVGTSSRRPSTSPSTTPPQTPPAAGNTTFRPVADSIMPRQMARALGETPEEQRRLEKMFSDLLENYRDRLKQAGAPSNDVSRAAAYLVTASYAVSQDERVSLDDAQLAALRRHLSQLFAGDEAFQRMTDRERQELFEDYGITATWIDAGYNIVKQAGDREAMRQWQEMARQNFAGVLGAPPEGVLFTAGGIQYK